MYAARTGPGAIRTATAVAVALVASMVLFFPSQPASAAAGVSTAVTVTSTTGAAGFQHPGVGVTADNLRNTQAQVAAGVEPWASYFDAMAMTSYASTTLTSRNQGSGDGVPASDAFDSRGINGRFIPDSLGAYTQALMYLFTGDPVYRENALKIVRVWSHMDPDKVAVFPDAHIHTGVPLYRMVAAAELLRATSVPDGAGAYPLEWTEQDTADLSANLIVPMTETFLHDNSHYMNQHSFPLIGAIAGYIFTDDRGGYDEAVEWFTLNATAPNQDINGALGAIFRVVEEDHPLNTFGRTFVQHQEMGRDQAHAGGDVNVLTTLARMVDAQATKLDPKTGVPSRRRTAVTPYAFLDDRLLRGADAYTGFMMGHEVPWIDLTESGGHISEAYRGRWSNPLNELYHVYTYDEGVDVGKIAPYLAEQYRQSDGALFYNGNSAEIGTVVGPDGLRSFWGGSDPGAEYWLSLPEEIAGRTPPVPESPALQFEEKGASIGEGSKLVTEDDRAFLRVAAVKKASTTTTLAMRSMSYGTRADYSPVGILVRSTGTSTLEVSSRVDAPPYHELTIPDTGGEWRYIVYDMDTDVVPLPAMGDNHIVYYSVVGNREAVDFDLVNLQAPSQLTPPRFAQGAAATIIGVAGSELAAEFTATDAGAEALAFTAVDAPAASGLDGSNGRFTWTPGDSDAGDHTFTVQATDGTTTAALAVTARVAEGREGAHRLARDGFDPDAIYTTVSRDAFDAASDLVQSLVDDGSDADFAAAILELQAAVSGLELLNPLLEDGTLAYPALVTSTLGTAKLGTLVDGDSATFSGDLRSTSFTLDFGADFRVRSSAFTLQARFGFGNRSQGTNVYGSNDNTVWTRLTTRMTTNTGEPETLPVSDELQSSTFRFIKVQVDEPGVPNDPNFPGIFSVAELKIHGERVEAVNAIDSAVITSDNTMPGRVANGDTVTLSFTSREAISQVQATIEGAPATVAGDGTGWTAVATLPDDVGYGRNLAFRVDYLTASGPADPLTVTSDGSGLYLSNETNLIGDVPARASVVSPTGDIETGKVAHLGKLFDQAAATFSDVGPVNGQYYITLDFHEGGSVALDRAEALVRQDNNGLNRAPNTHLQGSNDNLNWTRVSNNATSTLAWQNLGRPDADAEPVAYRYLRIVNTDWLNLAELRLFGTYTAPPPSFISTAKISSSNTMPSLAVPGDTVSLALTATEPLAEVHATIGGEPVAATSANGVDWVATATVPTETEFGRTVGFRVEYTTAAGAPGRPFDRTTDASSVFLTTNDGLIDGVPGRVSVVGPTGTVETAKVAHVGRLFDQNAATFTDVGPVNGQYYITLDFHEGGSIALARAEALIRQNIDGLRRAANTHLQGSNDNTSWTRITNNATGTLAWQTLDRPDPTAEPVAYRYLRITNTDWVNLAELRLFGTVTAPPQ